MYCDTIVFAHVLQKVKSLSWFTKHMVAEKESKKNKENLTKLN